MKKQLALLLAAAAAGAHALAAGDPVRIDGRRQLFVDDYLIDHLAGTELQLQHPIPREIVMVRDRPWEGSGTDFERLIRDGEMIRLYYMAADLTSTDGLSFNPSHRPAVACVAQSLDGRHWVRPEVGLFDFGGSKDNNIIWAQPGLDNFTPFLDRNPECPADERYKAMSAGHGRVLWAFKSADGIHWSRLLDHPAITHGTFDSQNNAFWDPVRRQYWCYVRGFHNAAGQDFLDDTHGIRDIRVSVSKDFRHWSEPRMIAFPGAPEEAFYTNQIEPYYRAPELLVGFPTRYVDRLKWPAAAFRSLPDPVHRQRRMRFSARFGTTITDGQFMTSRDGYAFHRWDETFIRPGPERSNNWLYGDAYQALGLLQTPADDPTAPPELSIYAGEGEWKENTVLRRFTLRVDGFVSVHARQKPGELVTRDLIFSGQKLSLNFASSAAGSIHVEIQDSDGHPIPGFTLEQSDELFGDTLDRTVTWGDKSDVSALAGRPVRLRFVLSDADLYSLKFED